MASDKAYSVETRLNTLIPALAPVIPADPWHVITTINNTWTGTIAYRFMPGALVELEFNLDSTTATNTGLTTLPAAYQPAATRYVPVGASANVASGVGPMVQITTGAVLFMIGMHAFSTAGTWAGNGFYRL